MSSNPVNWEEDRVFHTSARQLVGGTADNSRDSFELMGLPVELRLEVYRHYLLSVQADSLTEYIVMTKSGTGWSHSYYGPLQRLGTTDGHVHPHRMAVLRACRRIYEEALPEVYKIISVKLIFRCVKRFSESRWPDDSEFTLTPRWTLIRNLTLEIRYENTWGIEGEVTAKPEMVIHVLEALDQGSRLNSLTIYINRVVLYVHWPPSAWQYEEHEFPHMLMFSNLRFQGTGPAAAVLFPPESHSLVHGPHHHVGGQALALLQKMGRRMRLGKKLRLPPVYPGIDGDGFAIVDAKEE